MASTPPGKLSIFGRFHRDLQSGNAGWIIRAGASIGSAFIFVALMLIGLGFFEMAGMWVRDHHVALGLCVSGLFWCLSLIYFWKGWSKAQRSIRTILTIVSVWFVIIPLCVFIESVASREEMVITGLIILGLGLTFFIIGLNTYRALGGRDIQDEKGGIRVLCPSCKYSLVGLSSSNCPECGWVGTIDQLIEQQNYAAVREEMARLKPDERVDPFDDADLLEDD